MFTLMKPTPLGLNSFSFCNQTKNKNKFTNPFFLSIKGQATLHSSSSSSSSSFSLKDYILDKTNSINKALEDTFSRMELSKLVESMRYSVLAGGKKIRPVLCIAGFELFGGLNESVIMPCACAVEMLHTGSLIHDDLPCMDNSDLRRWKPASHVAFGENIALLSGDALIPLAFELIASSVDINGVSPEKVLKASRELAVCSGAKGLIAGQVADVSFGSDIGLEELEYIHVHKAGAMMEASVVIGAILGGANEDEITKLRRYGRCIGWSIQIIDDVLDVTKSSQELGKNVGKDLGNEKWTYPRIIGIEKSQELAENLIQEACDLLLQFDDHKASPLIGLAHYCITRKY